MKVLKINPESRDLFRNLPPAQRLAVSDKFKKKIQEQAHTDKENAKMVGVGIGTCKV